MFEGVKTRYPIILPILEEDYVVDKIIDYAEKKEEILIMPNFIWLQYLSRYFPGWLVDDINRRIGVTATMDHFKGRQNQQKQD